MAPPCIYDKPMTPAERQRRHRRLEAQRAALRRPLTFRPPPPGAPEPVVTNPEDPPIAPAPPPPPRLALARAGRQHRPLKFDPRALIG
jgi:hypothetical protein